MTINKQTIFESDNFTVVPHNKPEVSRTDGGHIVISPKVAVTDRTQLSSKLVIELALITNIAGIAMQKGLAKQGIKIGRINYQDNGNWKPTLHVHLYGRAIDATYQIYGQPLIVAKNLKDVVVQEPLNNQDCKLIRVQALTIANKPEYQSIIIY